VWPSLCALQAQQLHQAEAAARQAEAEAAVGAAAAAAAIEQQLQQQLSDAQQLLAGKTEDLSGILADKDELHSRLGLKQQQCSELQQQLEAEQGRSADGRSQVAALESELSEARAALKDKGAALDVAQEQAKHLQQGAEAAAAAATARADQLSSDLAAARESSKSRQEELLKQVTEVHLRLSAAQTEQERLQDELDASSSDVGLLQARHAEAQGEIDNLRVRDVLCCVASTGQKAVCACCCSSTLDVTPAPFVTAPPSCLCARPIPRRARQAARASTVSCCARSWLLLMPLQPPCVTTWTTRSSRWQSCSTSCSRQRRQQTRSSTKRPSRWVCR
jgi:DNA repair exonuclease SbcCD ATPase subunit